MNLPLEIVQQIKEHCTLREANILSSLNIGWKTKKQLFYDEWHPRVVQIADPEMKHRLYPDEMYINECVFCRFAFTGTVEELMEYYRKLHQLKQAECFYLYYSFGMETLEDFVETFKSILEYPDFYHGPLMLDCPLVRAGRRHF